MTTVSSVASHRYPLPSVACANEMTKIGLTLLSVMAFSLVAVQGDEPSQWDKIGAKLSEIWDKTKETVSDGAKTIGQHAEKFGSNAKETAEKLFKNAKTEVGITPDKES
ncbi:uncharacterized protein LOC111258641 isoform X1 [Varroa jacobsoni]|nr:uncharacterized protein LOC111258641 isoform X1 [Varroa jacobsoni]